MKLPILSGPCELCDCVKGIIIYRKKNNLLLISVSVTRKLVLYQSNTSNFVQFLVVLINPIIKSHVFKACAFILGSKSS